MANLPYAAGFKDQIRRDWLVYRRLEGIFELPDRRGRIVSMEGARGLAILLVFLVHYHALFGGYAGPHTLTARMSNFGAQIGHAGVDLFFVISGYLIYGALIRKPINIKTYLRRRTQRIYPTFLCVLGLYLILLPLFPMQSKMPGTLPREAGFLLMNLLLLPGIVNVTPIVTVAWSLSYEFFFYIAILAVVVVGRMQTWPARRRIGFFGLVTIVYFGLAFVGHAPYVQMLMFLSGVLVYEIAAGSGREARSRANPFSEFGVCFLFLISFPIVYALQARLGVGTVPRSGTSLWACRTLVLYVSFFLFALLCFHYDGRLQQIFSWTPLRWIGNMSYSFYLIHGMVLHAVAKSASYWIAPAGQNAFWFWFWLPIAFLSALVVSTLLFVSVEKRYSLPARAGVQQ